MSESAGKTLRIAFSAVAAVALTACGWFFGARSASRTSFASVGEVEARSAADERMRHAERLVSEGRSDEACEIYRRLEVERPADPLVRFRLGNLLNSYDDRFGEAIIEYEAYLRLAPDSEMADEVKKRLQGARDHYTVNLNGGVQTDANMQRKLQLQSDRIEFLEAFGADFTNMLSAVREENDLLKAEVGRLQREVEFQKRINGIGGAAPSSGAGAPSKDLSKAVNIPQVDAAPPVKNLLGDENRTYVVRKGDTLSLIAETFYGDADEKNVIKIRNANAMKPDDALAEGRVIIIP